MGRDSGISESEVDGSTKCHFNNEGFILIYFINGRIDMKVLKSLDKFEKMCVNLDKFMY